MNLGLFDHDGFVRGLDLRSWLAVELHASVGAVSVAELVDRLHTQGLDVDGRASKAISDALRWEVRRRRVRKLARGLYAAGPLARTTLFRMRRRITAALNRARHAGRSLLAAIVAPTRNNNTRPWSLAAVRAVNYPGFDTDGGTTPPSVVTLGRTARVTREMYGPHHHP
jgi:hypothetical protein